MDIFSLLPANSNDPNQQEYYQEEGGYSSNDEGQHPNDDSDSYLTPRTESTLATPRLFSTPPRSPPRSPPRPTSNIDTRIRMRRYKLSLSPRLTPSSSPLKTPSLVPDGSSSKASSPAVALFDSRHENNSPFSTPSQSPLSTPNSSPTKTDILSLSPLQQRLARARSKREQIIETRVQTIDVKIKTKELEASKRKEDATMEKITKARTEESIIQAKERRAQLDVDKQLHMLTLQIKEKEALRRKEDVTMERIEKARTEDSILQAKERRDNQLSQRVQTVEAIIETKSKEAAHRVERNLLQKQQRACRKEQNERAERRRKLLWYERRAKLLESIDSKLERATRRSNEITNEKAIKASEELARAKEVARKVRAARVIQEVARDVYGFAKVENGDIELSQHAAALRLQRWKAWRAAICKRRLGLLLSESDGKSNALDELLKLFHLPEEDKKQQQQQQQQQNIALSFGEITMQMRSPVIQHRATVIIDCLFPIIDIHFASSSKNKMDGRSLLTFFLIAVHPLEVFGDDYKDDDRTDARYACGTKLLTGAAAALLKLMDSLPRKTDFAMLESLLMKTTTLFNWWKNMDLDQLLTGLSKQLEQSWVIYITSSETLKYLAEVTGISEQEDDLTRNDPLMQLRLRHRASQSGSRSHIKRIRLSLNKLIGSDEGKEVVKEAKVVAKREIEATNAVEVLKQEVDEMNDGFPYKSEIGGDTDAAGGEVSKNDEPQSPALLLPEEIASNRSLIHRVLVTDPADFDKLSWDGVDSQQPEVSPEEFMSFFVPMESSEESINNPEDLPMRIAMNMKLAFFNSVAQEMSTENYVPVRELLKALHDKMRTLLPNRQDLHSHINDEAIGYSSCASDVIRVLIRSGYLLSNYLESPSRAETTRELITCLEAFNSRFRNGGDNTPFTIPYGLETEHLFVVASIAFVLQKAELCQLDVSNYKFAQLAPYIHQVGSEYERGHFTKTYGDFTAVSNIRELRQMLPSTNAWIKETLGLCDSTDNITLQSSLDQKMDFIKGRGYVDGILFTKNHLVLPELFSLDVESINNIRNTARCCVIASALSLHACNIIGSSVLNKSEDNNIHGNILTSGLTKKHFSRDQLESEVIAGLTSFTSALAERSLTDVECETLKNHALAVLRGSDPVLKLLDNRVRSYFRFACRWTPADKSMGISAPVEMKTGRPLNDNSLTQSHSGIASSKAEFSLAANKEAKRLGFGFVTTDLIEAGNRARLIISLVCANYDKYILSPLFKVEEV